jgi:hypothetical protein
MARFDMETALEDFARKYRMPSHQAEELKNLAAKAYEQGCDDGRKDCEEDMDFDPGGGGK